MDETITYLIEGCRKGNRSAQLALYKQHAPRLYAACFRIIGHAAEAEEAMQDAFLKILPVSTSIVASFVSKHGYNALLFIQLSITYGSKVPTWKS